MIHTIAVLRKSSTASTRLAMTDMDGTELTTTTLPTSKMALAIILTQMANVTTGSSLSKSASSSQGILGFGPEPSEGRDGSSPVFVWCSSGRFSEATNMSFGPRFVLLLDVGGLSRDSDTAVEVVPYETGFEMSVLGEAAEGVAVLDSSLIVSGTLKAEASGSLEYSSRSSCGMAESKRQSMYRHCSMSSFVR